jgi:hypothetical protein
MSRIDAATFGRWTLYRDSAVLALEVDGEVIEIDCRDLPSLKRLAALVFLMVGRLTAEDFRDLVLALAAVLDPLRTLVPPASKALGRWKIHDRVTLACLRRAAEVEADTTTKGGRS